MLFVRSFVRALFPSSFNAVCLEQGVSVFSRIKLRTYYNTIASSNISHPSV